MDRLRGPSCRLRVPVSQSEPIMPTLWNSDDDLFTLARRELFTAVVGDVMDKLGLLRQFLDPKIQPLRDDMVVLGRAMTVLEADCFIERAHASNNPLMAK